MKRYSRDRQEKREEQEGTGEERECKRVQQNCRLHQVWKVSVSMNSRTNESGDGFLAGSTGTGGCTIP